MRSLALQRECKCLFTLNIGDLQPLSADVTIPKTTGLLGMLAHNPSTWDTEA